MVKHSQLPHRTTLHPKRPERWRIADAKILTLEAIGSVANSCPREDVNWGSTAFIPLLGVSFSTFLASFFFSLFHLL